MTMWRLANHDMAEVLRHPPFNLKWLRGEDIERSGLDLDRLWVMWVDPSLEADRLVEPVPDELTPKAVGDARVAATLVDDLGFTAHEDGRFERLVRGYFGNEPMQTLVTVTLTDDQPWHLSMRKRVGDTGYWRPLSTTWSGNMYLGDQVAHPAIIDNYVQNLRLAYEGALRHAAQGSRFAAVNVVDEAPEHHDDLFQDQDQPGQLNTQDTAYPTVTDNDDSAGADPWAPRRKFEGWTDQLPGGKADDMESDEFDPDELAEGTRHEMEHVSDPLLAREIAMDHLAEDPQYYTHLRKIEGEGPGHSLVDLTESGDASRHRGPPDSTMDPYGEWAEAYDSYNQYEDPEHKVGQLEHTGPTVAVDLDGTLLREPPRDKTLPSGQLLLMDPEPDAADTMRTLEDLGWRILVYTARFSFAQSPEQVEQWQTEIEDHLQRHDIPFEEVWVGPKPAADYYIDNRAVRYDGDWHALLTDLTTQGYPKPNLADDAMGHHGVTLIDTEDDPNDWTNPTEHRRDLSVDPHLGRDQ